MVLLVADLVIGQVEVECVVNRMAVFVEVEDLAVHRGFVVEIGSGDFEDEEAVLDCIPVENRMVWHTVAEVVGGELKVTDSNH